MYMPSSLSSLQHRTVFRFTLEELVVPCLLMLLVVGGNYKTYLLRSVLRRSSLRCFLTSATSMVTLPGVHS